MFLTSYITFKAFEVRARARERREEELMRLLEHLRISNVEGGFELEKHENKEIKQVFDHISIF